MNDDPLRAERAYAENPAFRALVETIERFARSHGMTEFEILLAAKLAVRLIAEEKDRGA